VLTWDDWEALFYVAAQEYDFEYDFSQCPYDYDHDGYVEYRNPGGDDCDDFRDFINPGQIEECGAPTCSNNFDDDCDGVKDAADPDCTEWCPTAAEASTIGSTQNSRNLNLFFVALLPFAFVIIWRVRRKTG
jgi:hypothetical protein